MKCDALGVVAKIMPCVFGFVLRLVRSRRSNELLSHTFDSYESSPTYLKPTRAHS